jgi:hypothetical protein
MTTIILFRDRTCSTQVNLDTPIAPMTQCTDGSSGNETFGARKYMKAFSAVSIVLLPFLLVFLQETFGPEDTTRSTDAVAESNKFDETDFSSVPSQLT